jgi:uncharacterized membrane protein
MRTLALGLMAAMLVAPLATSADAAPKDRDRSKAYDSKQYRYNSNQKGYGYNASPNGQSGACTVIGWRDSSNTPIFQCPGDPPTTGPIRH